MLLIKQKTELRVLLKEYPFLKNIHFVRTFLPEVNYKTLSAFANNDRQSIPDLDNVLEKCKSYIERLSND